MSSVRLTETSPCANRRIKLSMKPSQAIIKRREYMRDHEFVIHVDDLGKCQIQINAKKVNG